MAKTTVTRDQLCEMLLKEVREVPGLEGVSSITINPLADNERQNGANWSLAKVDPGHAEMDKVEAELVHIGLYMQREYAIEDERFSGL